MAWRAASDWVDWILDDGVKLKSFIEGPQFNTLITTITTMFRKDPKAGFNVVKKVFAEADVLYTFICMFSVSLVSGLHNLRAQQQC